MSQSKLGAFRTLVSSRFTSRATCHYLTSPGYSLTPNLLDNTRAMTEPANEKTTTTATQGPSWKPPTPTSSQMRFHSPSPKLPVDHLVLLPPPLVPTEREDCAGHARRWSHDQAHSHHPFYPSNLLPPLRLPEPSLPAPRSCVPEGPHAAAWVEEYTKRPRRSAAIAAAQNIPRQPSPLELDSDEDDDATFSPPPRGSHLSSTSSIKASSRENAGGGGGGAAGSGGASSKRKVSHSLIERRRREKINDCLSTLKETVPCLREEGAKKIAKAKERGRKRGRDDAGERGGLHKLEILQASLRQCPQRAGQPHLTRCRHCREPSIISKNCERG